MPKLDHDHVSRLVSRLTQLVLREAKCRGDDAGMRGEMNDGGQRNLEDQVTYFVHGFNRVVPPEWVSYEKELARKTDPEWAEYMRLKEKFE